MLEVQPLPTLTHQHQQQHSPSIKQERGLESKTDVLATDNLEAKNSDDFADDSGVCVIVLVFVFLCVCVYLCMWLCVYVFVIVFVCRWEKE